MSKFKYMRKDFKPLPVKLKHMDISISFIDGEVKGTNILKVTAMKDLATITLQAQDIDIHSVCVTCADGPSASWAGVDYEYIKDKDTLLVTLPDS